MRNIIVAQSGGPTTAINASLSGVLGEGLKNCNKAFGALHGISGVLNENFIEFSNDSDTISEFLGRLKISPACFLGSCRVKLPNYNEDLEIYKKLFEIFEKKEVDAFFYIGGNDSMDTISKLAAYGDYINSPIRFVGVPKTVDNDLICTDHTPGFGSAAKFIATSMLEMAHDTAIYEVPHVTIVEIMGRNAGWLTAAAALARNEYNNLPQLIYLPEVPFDKKAFINDVKAELAKTNNVVIAVSEGIKDKDGNYIQNDTATKDKFGHTQLSGAGKALELLVIEELGLKCRSVELNIVQRCAAHTSSKTDLDESESLGRMAVKFALDGESGIMPVLKRLSNNPYKCEIEFSKLSEIANKERLVPTEWITDNGNDVTDEMVQYLKPLIMGEINVEYKDGLPVYENIGHLY